LITEIAFVQVAPVAGGAEFESYMQPDDYGSNIKHFEISEETLSFHDKLKGDYLWELGQRSWSSQRVADELFIFLAQFRDIQMPLVVYCRGADFDPPRLRLFMKMHGYDLNELIHYRNFRDLRTAENLFPTSIVNGDHSAINDAKAVRQQLLMMAHKSEEFYNYLYGSCSDAGSI